MQNADTRKGAVLLPIKHEHNGSDVDPNRKMDEKSKAQLEILGEIAAIFCALDRPFWLRGGWAIDFLLGSVTRPHEDLDLVAFVECRDLLEQKLADAGYERYPISGRQTDFRKNGADIQVCYVTYTEDGQIILNGLPEWVWRKDALQTETFSLYGISACVLNPRQLLEEKEVYREIGRMPRPKDEESKTVLRGMIGSME